MQNIHWFKKNFTHRLSNKPFLIWLLKPSPHLKYVATPLCNLSLCTDINVSQGSVATYAKYGGIFNIHLTANLPRNLTLKFLLKWVKIWQKYGHEFVALLFLAHLVYTNEVIKHAAIYSCLIPDILCDIHCILWRLLAAQHRHNNTCDTDRQHAMQRLMLDTVTALPPLWPFFLNELP